MSEIEHIVTATWKDGRLSHVLDCSPKPDGQHPLYDQSAIDRLTAERDDALAAADSKAGWEWKKRAEKAEAERDVALADAKRYRWLCDGNGYFMEENMLCHMENEKWRADEAIDEMMELDEKGK